MTTTATTPDHDELLARARSLASCLAEHATEAERLRRLPDPTLQALQDSELERMVVPTSVGGFGHGLRTLGQTTRTLAGACPASAWTISFLVMHNWLVGAFGDRARAELFTTRPHVRVPAPLAPTGRLVPDVDGGADGEPGYRVTGRWDWATAVLHADWVMVHGVVVGGDPAAFESRFVLLPAADVVVEDTWHMSGMRATGSNSVVLDGVWVPAYRTVPAPDLLLPSGREARDGDGMAGLPVMPVLALVAAAPALGAAEAAVDLFRERLAERVPAYATGKQAEQPAAQVRLAEAMATVRAAAAVWERAIADLEAAAALGEVDVESRVAARLAAGSTVRLARQAIGVVADGSGASVYAESAPLQRWQRDVEVLKGHVVFDWDRTAEIAGRTALGLPLRPGDLV